MSLNPVYHEGLSQHNTNVDSWVTGCNIPCKAKRQYLLTCKVSRYCILALHSSILLFAGKSPVTMYGAKSCMRCVNRNYPDCGCVCVLVVAFLGADCKTLVVMSCCCRAVLLLSCCPVVVVLSCCCRVQWIVPLCSSRILARRVVNIFPEIKMLIPEREFEPAYCGVADGII